MSHGRPFRTNQLAWAAVLASIAFVYLYQAPYFAGLNNPNENVRIYTTRALVDHGTFAIDEVIEEWGHVSDKTVYDGRHYSAKPPGISLLAAPAYWTYSRANRAFDREPAMAEYLLVCRFTTTIPMLLLFLYAFARFTDRVVTDSAIRMLVVVAVALGSTMLTYGGLFVSHSLTAAAIFGSYMLIYRHRERPEVIWTPLLMGFLIGLAPAMEYPGGLGAAFIGLYAIYRSPTRRRFCFFSALGCALPVMFTLGFHQSAFDSPFAFPHAFLEDPEQLANHAAGFHGVGGLSADALHGSLFAPSNGLFWFAPWTMVAVVGLVFSIQFDRLKEPAFVTAGIFVIYVVFISSVDNWRGGWTAGPRYIVPLIPFLGWYLLVFLAEVRRTAMGTGLLVVSFGLLAASLAHCGMAAALFPHYPPGIENPTFELAGYLIRRGYAPYNALSPLGFYGIGTLAPVAAAFTIAFLMPFVCTVRREPVERLAGLILAVTMASGFLFLQSVPRTANTEYLWNARALVVDLWEPLDPVAEALDRDRSLPASVKFGRATEGELRSLARQAALRGLGQTAASLYADAVSAAEGDATDGDVPGDDAER